MSIFERDSQYIANTYARFPVDIISGHGAVAVDSDGKEYIDRRSVYSCPSLSRRSFFVSGFWI